MNMQSITVNNEWIEITERNEKNKVSIKGRGLQIMLLVEGVPKKNIGFLLEHGDVFIHEDSRKIFVKAVRGTCSGIIW